MAGWYLYPGMEGFLVLLQGWHARFTSNSVRELVMTIKPCASYKFDINHTIRLLYANNFIYIPASAHHPTGVPD
jgi:hypothetical protein